jgi:hypothetical protein
MNKKIEIIKYAIKTASFLFSEKKLAYNYRILFIHPREFEFERSFNNLNGIR